MANDLIVPEVLLVDKLEEMDNSLSVTIWKQMRVEAEARDEEENSHLPSVQNKRRKVFFADFVNKAISIPMDITPGVSDEVYKQFYRLYLFSCQQAIHYPEVKRNPFILGFHALGEIKTALVAIMVTYRLVTPSAPYSWSREFFENNIFVDKGSQGQAIIKFFKIPVEAINAAMTEEVVTDWMIYKAFDNNGIRTLMDIKNNLLTLPDYKRGGPVAAEFSRFQRKLAEERSKKEMRKSEALDLEFRKTLVQSVAEKTAEKLLASGLSANEILDKAFKADIAQLTSISDSESEMKAIEKNLDDKKDKMGRACNRRIAKKQDTTEVDGVIAGFLEDNS